MPSIKHRRRAKRRAEKLVEESLDALASGHDALADKLIQRALSAGPANARFWLEYARISHARGRSRRAERAVRRALELSPDYVEARELLDELVPSDRAPPDARVAAASRTAEPDGEIASLARTAADTHVASTARADDPHAAATTDAIDATGATASGAIASSAIASSAIASSAIASSAIARSAIASSAIASSAIASSAIASSAIASGAEPVVVSERTARFDWTAHAEDLVARGVTCLPSLLAVDECVALRALFDHDEQFEHDVQLDDERGRVRYRFFRRPLPELVGALRRELYARLAPIANRCNELVGDGHRWPLAHEDFLRVCAAGGHRRTSPILLRYPPGGSNGFHRDVYGAIYFPLQLAVSLGPARRADGGELALVDERPGKRKRVRVIATDIGDAVVFCTRERLVPIAGLYGRQPVLHGVQEIRAERYAVGIPFHDYAGGEQVRIVRPRGTLGSRCCDVPSSSWESPAAGPRASPPRRRHRRAMSRSPRRGSR